MPTAYQDPHRVRVTAIATLSRLRASSSVSLQRPTLSNLNMHRPQNSATKSANGSEVQGSRVVSHASFSRQNREHRGRWRAQGATVALDYLALLMEA